MRFVLSVRARMPADRREEYLRSLKRIATICRDCEHVQGFYLMERADAAGEFWEFYEFAEEAAASALAGDPRYGELAERFRARAGETMEVSTWYQRM